MNKIEVRPNSIIQEYFLGSQVDELGAFGKKGWGKTWGVLQECLHDVKHGDFRAIIFRRTSSDFEDMIQKAHIHFAGYNPKYNGTKHIFTFPSGATVRFAHLQHPNDIFIYNGQEFQLIVFDELPQFPIMVYKFMFSCLRGTNPNIIKRIRATGNPYGESMLQVKSRFYDALKPGRVDEAGVFTPPEIGWFKTHNNKDVRASKDIERRLMELVQNHHDWRELKAKDGVLAPYMSRAWLFGERSHNTDLMIADPGYEARLDQLPEDQKLAYKEGLFVITDNDRQLVKTRWLQRAIDGVEVKGIDRFRFGADYAELGKDKCCVVLGRRNQVVQIDEWDYMSHSDFAQKLYDIIIAHGRYQCLGGVDSVGTGSGVYTNLADNHGITDRVDPMRYKDVEYEKSIQAMGIQIKFDNLRSQMYYKLARDLENGEIDLSLLTTEDYFYENLVDLQEEILAHRCMTVNGVFKVIPKNEIRKMQVGEQWGGGVGLGRSPDRCDALAIWNWVRSVEEVGGKAEDLPEDVDYGGYRKYFGRNPEPEETGYT